MHLEFWRLFCFFVPNSIFTFSFRKSNALPLKSCKLLKYSSNPHKKCSITSQVHSQYNQHYTRGSCGTLNYGPFSRNEGFFTLTKNTRIRERNWQFNLESCKPGWMGCVRCAVTIKKAIFSFFCYTGRIKKNKLKPNL